MPNTWITDAPHFLDAGRVTQRSGTRGIVRHIGAIISAVTQQSDSPQAVPSVPCRRRPGRAPCPGTIAADVDESNGTIIWECAACGDRGLISKWQGTPWDQGGRSNLPTIDRLTYRSGMLNRASDISKLPAVILEGAMVTRDIVVAIYDNHLLQAGGDYGDPRLGAPIQYDELIIEHGQGTTAIRVFNRAIMLFTTHEDIYVRVHRVCCKVEKVSRNRQELQRR